LRAAARQCASVLAGEARRSRGCVRLRASQRGGVQAEMPGQAGSGASGPAPCAPRSGEQVARPVVPLPLLPLRAAGQARAVPQWT